MLVHRRHAKCEIYIYPTYALLVLDQSPLERQTLIFVRATVFKLCLVSHDGLSSHVLFHI